MLVAVGDGLGVGLVVAALVLGLRHGVDWDHLAAITDITAAQDSAKRGVVLGTLYALGHAAVVLVIGIVAIAAGKSLPDWADAMMGTVVGWTLVLLGAYLVYSLIRDRGRVQLRSRWMLVLSGVRQGYLAVRSRLSGTRAGTIEHDHGHAAVDTLHHATPADHPGSGDDSRWRAPSHRHAHSHDLAHEPFVDYGKRTSVGVGMLHGIGAETPTQVLVFLAAAEAGGTAAGIAVLVVFLIGLFVANTAITVGASYSFLNAAKRPRLRVALAGVTATVSLAIGVLLIVGQDAVLPALLAG